MSDQCGLIVKTRLEQRLEEMEVSQADPWKRVFPIKEQLQQRPHDRTLSKGAGVARSEEGPVRGIEYKVMEVCGAATVGASALILRGGGNYNSVLSRRMP